MMRTSPFKTRMVMVVLFVSLGAGLSACGPTTPGPSQGPGDSPSSFPDGSARPSLMVPTVKPGSSQAPILTVEPPQPVIP